MIRSALRHLITRAVEGEVVKGTITAMTADTIPHIQSADLTNFPDHHFRNASILIYSGTGIGQTNVVSDSAKTSGELTPSSAWGVTPVAGDLFELHYSNYPKASDYNDAIDYAYTTIQDIVLSPNIDESLAAERYRTEYPIPSGFRYLSAVCIEPESIGSDRCYGSYNYQTQNGLFIASSSTKLSQGFKLGADVWASKVFLYLEKRGTISTARTLTVRIETDSSGLPSGTLIDSRATGTLSTNSVFNPIRYCQFTFSAPVFIPYNTTYHIVLSVSGTADASEYIAWGRDTASYGNGYAGTYDGASWSAISDATFVFSIGTAVQEQDWVYLPQGYWKVVPSNDTIKLSVHDEGKALRLIGQSQLSLMTADTDTVTGAEEYIMHKSAAYLLASLAKGPAKDLDANNSKAAFHETQADKHRMAIRTQAYPNSVPVEAR